MSEVQVRPFRRPDREQLTALVNAHVQAVVPGVSVSVNTVMSQLERDPGEFIVDPWVAERGTLVADQRGRVVAAAHLLRYGAGAEVGETIRGAGEINWLLYWPEASYWPDSTAAADALMAACLDQLRRWQVTRWSADGALPAPGVYGLPEQWPHIRALYERAGFVHDGHTEIVLLARVDELPRPSEPPVAGLEVRRTVGINGTRLSGSLGEQAGRLHRGRHQPGRGRAPGPPGRLGRCREPPRRRGLPPARRRHLAGRPGGGLAPPGPGGAPARVRLARGAGPPGAAGRSRLPRADPHRPRVGPPARDGGGNQPGRSRSRRVSSTSRSWARRRATSGVTPPRSRRRRSSSRWAPSRSDTRLA